MTDGARFGSLGRMNTQPERAAVAYYRTSSATNVGTDKDSLDRQRAAVASCAAAQGLYLVAEFYDAAVSGADPVESRKGFGEMLTAMLSNCARIIVVENATRFARDLMVQEIGHHALKAQGIELIAADSPDSFVSDTPTAVLIRQILGAVAQFEKAMLVNKLRGARDRKSAKLGRRVEGRARVPDAAVEAANALALQGLTLRAIARELYARGFQSRCQRAYGPQSVKAMIRRE